MADQTAEASQQDQLEQEIQTIGVDVKNVASLATSQKTQIDSIQAALDAAKAAGVQPDLSTQLAELGSIHTQLAAIGAPATAAATQATGS